MARRCFIAGNWKMNKSVAESLALVRELRNAISVVRDRVEVAIASWHDGRRGHDSGRGHSPR